MDKIDLDAIALRFINARPHHTKLMIAKAVAREAIHQALIMVSLKAEKNINSLLKGSFEGWSIDSVNGYQTASISIIDYIEKINDDVENLIV